MKFLAPALLAVFLASSCEKATEAANSMKDSAAKLDTDTLKAEGEKLVSQIGTQLGEIKDQATAENVSKQLEPVLASLASLKDKLGLQNLDMSSIEKAIDDLTSKFSSDSNVMGVIQPVIDKLKALMK